MIMLKIGRFYTHVTGILQRRNLGLFVNGTILYGAGIKDWKDDWKDEEKTCVSRHHYILCVVIRCLCGRHRFLAAVHTHSRDPL